MLCSFQSTNAGDEEVELLTPCVQGKCSHTPACYITKYYTVFKVLILKVIRTLKIKQ